MRLLAVESATVEVGVALTGEEGLLAAATVRPGRRHAETLHPLLQAVAARAGTPLAELDALAVDVGPGLFTGLRVGLAAAKALAFALGLPLVAATSTEVLLHACRWHPGPVAAVVDMRRGELAWALAGPGGPGGPAAGPGAASQGTVPPGLPAGLPAGALPRLGTAEELAEALARLDAPALLVGDGARRLAREIAGLVAARGGPPPRPCGDELGAPPVASLADLGRERFAAGLVVDPLALAPCYLREADARSNWTTRHEDAAARAAAAAGRA